MEILAVLERRGEEKRGKGSRMKGIQGNGIARSAKSTQLTQPRSLAPIQLMAHAWARYNADCNDYGFEVDPTAAFHCGPEEYPDEHPSRNVPSRGI